MLCCLAELGIMVFGIVVLATGKVKISSDRVVQGAPARVIGAILLLPLILGVGGEFLLGIILGVQQARTGQPITAAEIQAKMQIPVLILHATVFVLTFGVAFAIALAYGRRPDRAPRDLNFGDAPAGGHFPGGGPPDRPYGGPSDQFRPR
jgi:hypothetical protein